MVTVGHLTVTCLNTISDVLSRFILIELSRFLADYFDNNRLRLAYIVDAGIVFVVREIMIKLFQDKLLVEHIMHSVLGVLRVGSVLLYEPGNAASKQHNWS